MCMSYRIPGFWNFGNGSKMEPVHDTIPIKKHPISHAPVIICVVKSCVIISDTLSLKCRINLVGWTFKGQELTRTVFLCKSFVFNELIKYFKSN